jgi:hypothetical protein
MRFKTLLFAVLVVAAMVAASCTKNNLDGGKNDGAPDSPVPSSSERGEWITERRDYGKLLMLDITDAKALYVTNAGTTRAGDGSVRHGVTINKITIDDQTREVAVRDENNREIPLNFCELFTVTDDLIGVKFGYMVDVYETWVTPGETENDGEGEPDDGIAPEPDGQEEPQNNGEYKPEDRLIRSEPCEVTYWIRKSDGAAFLVPNAFWDLRSDRIQMDNLGNIYYYNYGLYKIYTDENGGINAKEHIGSNFADHLGRSYTVDGEGNVYFGREFDRLHCVFADGTSYLSEGYYPSDGYNVLSTCDNGFGYVERGEKTTAPYTDESGSTWDRDATHLTFCRATANAASHTVEFEQQEQITIFSHSFYINVLSRANGIAMISIDGCYYYSDINELIVFNSNASGSMLTRYPGVDLRGQQIYNSLNNAYWIGGGISRLNYATGEIEVIFSDSDYAIYSGSLTVSADDSLITFEAIKMSNLEKVSCEITNGVFSETPINTGSDNPNDEVITFIRL